MVGRGDHDNIAWQIIYLHQKRSHNAFDFARLVFISALFTDGVKFIKEKHARCCARILKDPLEARSSFPEEAANHSLISNDKQRNRETFRDCFGQGCLTVAGRADEQNAVPWF
jgi:hypothetical protein